MEALEILFGSWIGILSLFTVLGSIVIIGVLVVLGLRKAREDAGGR